MNDKTPRHDRGLPHPDFDGHLTRPIEQMTYAERLDLGWFYFQLTRLRDVGGDREVEEVGETEPDVGSPRVTSGK